MTRAFLTLVGLIFVAYGGACALDPTLPARLAGLGILNGDGHAEMSAMYGGLQSGVAAFLLLAAIREQDQPPALFLLVLGIGLLATLRAIGALTATEAVSTYTWGALAFETIVALTALFLLRRRNPV